ncbi:hypothetical protein KCU83_g502, partial [Aureobasidium melanogenum]
MSAQARWFEPQVYLSLKALQITVVLLVLFIATYLDHHENEHFPAEYLCGFHGSCTAIDRPLGLPRYDRHPGYNTTSPDFFGDGSSRPHNGQPKKAGENCASMSDVGSIEVALRQKLRRRKHRRACVCSLR